MTPKRRLLTLILLVYALRNRYWSRIIIIITVLTRWRQKMQVQNTSRTSSLKQKPASSWRRQRNKNGLERSRQHKARTKKWLLTCASYYKNGETYLTSYTVWAATSMTRIAGENVLTKPRHCHPCNECMPNDSPVSIHIASWQNAETLSPLPSLSLWFQWRKRSITTLVSTDHRYRS